LSGRLRPATWPAVFALALGLRLVCLLEWHRTLLFTTPIGDARAYLDWARAIAGGDWWGHEAFYQAPLYPYGLALVLRIGGSETWGPRLVQAVLGALACVAVGRAAVRFFDRVTGIAAGVGLALYAPAIYFDGLIQKPALDGFLMAVLLLVLSGALTRNGVGRALGSGLLLGLLALTRENVLVLVPVVALWLAALPGRETSGRRVGLAAACVLGVLLVLVPVGLRNRAVGGEFLLTTAQLGPNLWIGNHAGATGRYQPLKPGRGSARFERQDAHDLAVAAAGRPLDAGEVSTFWRDRALADIEAQPARWLGLMATKLGLVWRATELPDTEGIEAYTEASWLLRALRWPFSFGVLVPLAFVGAIATRADWRRLWLLPAMAVSLAAAVALFYVFARYRFALVPVLMPLAAAGGVSLWRARSAGLPWLAAGLVLAVPVNWPVADANGLGLTHYGVGSQLLDDGHLADAQAELERAVTADPRFAAAHARLGDVLRKRSALPQSLAAYDRALALDPTLADAHAGRGIALEGLGRGEEADAAYARALALDPDHPDANNNSANRLQRAGRATESLARYQRALASRPDDPDIAANYGAALVQVGQPARALAVLDPVVARLPGAAVPRFNRAAALAAVGRLDEARADLRALIAQEPPGSEYAKAARDALAALGAP
jgi:Tfp pilus assembly protein PilF/4-amino-4-deoxy-L-arabinose transferase-like glycosyltransferase